MSFVEETEQSGAEIRTSDEDDEAKDVAKFLEEVDNYSPTFPEAIVQQYLLQGGAACDDLRV